MSFQVLVAFNNAALDDPALITTIAAPGVAGGAAPTLGAVNVWTDITQYVERFSYGRGRQHELDRFESSILTLDLRNMGAVFNPWNTSGPFYGLLLPGKLIQVRNNLNAVIYKRYTGNVFSWPVLWPDEVESHTQVQASDAFRNLALANITSAQYAATVKADGATAYFRLGEPPGSITVADSTANAHLGTLKGVTTLGVAGALASDVNTAIDLGAYKGYATLDPGAGVTGGGAFTIECWIQVTSAPQSTGDIFYYQGDATLTTSISIYLVPNPGTPAGPADLYFTASDATNAATGYALASVPWNDHKWHHITCVRETDGKTLTSYVDGVMLHQETLGAVVTLAAPTRPSIGSFQNQLVGWFGGEVDEFAIYVGVALTAAQVMARCQAGIAPWSNNTSGTRIAKVLDAIGWSAGARNIDPGVTVVQPAPASLSSTKALTYMQLVEQTENGALFVDGSGKIRFMSRSTIITAHLVSQITFGDGGGAEIPFQPSPDMALDDADLWNEINVTRAGGVLQSALDSASASAFFRHTQDITGLLFLTDQESADRAQWSLIHLSQPIYRLRTFKVRLLGKSVAVQQSILALELLDRVTINKHTITGGGTSFTQTALLEHMTEDYDAETGDWMMSFSVSSSDAVLPYWILDDATYSILGSTTVLAL